MTLNGFVKGHLLERSARIGVGRDQCIGIRVNEDADRQCLGSQHDLCSGFVLAVKHMNGTLAALALNPRQRHMQLRSLLVELLDQLRNVRSDRPGIDVVVVRQILNWKIGEEEAKTAQFIFVNRHGT